MERGKRESGRHMKNENESEFVFKQLGFSCKCFQFAMLQQIECDLRRKREGEEESEMFFGIA